MNEPSAPEQTDENAPRAAGRSSSVEAERAARRELLRHVDALAEPVMVLLGLLFLGLVAVGFSGIDLSPVERRGINRAQAIIYGVFLLDFAVRWFVAPGKLAFLKGNWLLLLSLVVPAVRPLRAVRGLAALRSFHLLRALTGLNRGMRALRQVTRGRQFAYLLALSVVVVLLGAGSVLSLDRGVPGAEIRSFGEALWWSATLVTTINSADDPVSFEGRVVGFLLRVYALSVFGYLTASIATYFIGTQGAQNAEGAQNPPGGAAQPAADDQVEALRREIARLRQDLEGRGMVAGEDRRPDGPPAESPSGQ